MNKKRVKILDIPFDPVMQYDVLKIIDEQLNNPTNKPFFIATPNPEMLLAADKNNKFKAILQKTNLNIPDGIGILWASTYLNSVKNSSSRFIKILKGVLSLASILIFPKKIRHILPERVTGTDIMQKICKNIDPKTRVFLLGGSHGVAERTKEILKEKYKLNIVGTNDGSADELNDENLITIINHTHAEFLFVAFGAPKQELWLARNLKHLKTVKVAIGIGGAFDFISGKTKRAPAFMQKLGLEWLYRLIKQPSRIKRIFNATVKFPIKVIFNTGH